MEQRVSVGWAAAFSSAVNSWTADLSNKILVLKIFGLREIKQFLFCCQDRRQIQAQAFRFLSWFFL